MRWCRPQPGLSLAPKIRVEVMRSCALPPSTSNMHSRSCILLPANSCAGDARNICRAETRTGTSNGAVQARKARATDPGAANQRYTSPRQVNNNAEGRNYDRRQSGGTASTSGRSEREWTDSNGIGPPRNRSSASWGRRMDPLWPTAPKPGARDQFNGNILQRGPVQPAVFTDRSAAFGTDDRKLQDSERPSGLQNSSSRPIRALKTAIPGNGADMGAGRNGQGRRPPSEASQRSLQESQLMRMQGPRREADMSGKEEKLGEEQREPAQRPVTNEAAGLSSTEAIEDNFRAEAQSGAEESSLPAPRRILRGRAPFRNLWGRKPSAQNGSQPGLPKANDWAETEILLPEVEGGWGDDPDSDSALEQPGNENTQQPQQSALPTPEEAMFDGAEYTGKTPEFEAEMSAIDEELEEEPLSVPEAELLDDPDDFIWEEEEEGDHPDITLLPSSEVDDLIPVVPTPEQMGSSWGSPLDVWQRLGAAAFATLVTAKLNLVFFASGSATFPFWGPVLLAANRNRLLRKSGRHVGFWRTNVLDVVVERPQRRRYTDRTISGPAISRPRVRFLLGDDSGARSQLSLPFNQRYEQIQVGEPAELLVLSMHSRFASFKALKEVYLPVSGLWLSEYPHINRNLFLDISLDIERERKQEMMEGAYEAAI